jgi:hypothetical protein
MERQKEKEKQMRSGLSLGVWQYLSRLRALTICRRVF